MSYTQGQLFNAVAERRLNAATAAQYTEAKRRVDSILVDVFTVAFGVSVGTSWLVGRFTTDGRAGVLVGLLTVFVMYVLAWRDRRRTLKAVEARVGDELSRPRAPERPAVMVSAWGEKRCKRCGRVLDEHTNIGVCPDAGGSFTE